MEAQDRGYSLKQIWDILGNGNEQKGRRLLEKLAERLEHARNCHKWGKEGECFSALSARGALEGEILEWYHEILLQNPEREHDEALDVLAVAVRMANREFAD